MDKVILLVKINKELDPNQRVRRLLKLEIETDIGSYSWKSGEELHVGQSTVNAITRYTLEKVCLLL